MNDMRQQRKVVFFLGAGASFGAGAYASVQHGGRWPIPTQDTFWDTFFRFCKSNKNKRAIESFLFRYFLAYKRVPGRTKRSLRSEQLKTVNVEEVFTFLSERARAPSTSPQLRGHAKRIWHALVEEIPNVFGRFTANDDTKNIYRQLTYYFIRKRDTVVSFNYDTIFESSLPTTYRWHYECLQQKARSVGIIKPHGSISWNVDDSGSVTITDGPENPLIVAPTHLKFVSGTNKSSDSATEFEPGYLDGAPIVRKIWKSMEREMREAKALVFIGYSFPAADLYFSSVLRSVLADRDGAPGVVVVNPDAVAIRDELQRRFSLSNILMYLDFKHFIRGDRKEIFELLGIR